MKLDWPGLDYVGLGLIILDRTGLDYIGLDWITFILDWAGLH
jgi:hypothetical protein